MPFRYTPYNMDRPIVPILLEDQHAGAFRIIRVIIYNDGFNGSVHDIPREEIVR